MHNISTQENLLQKRTLSDASSDHLETKEPVRLPQINQDNHVPGGIANLFSEDSMTDKSLSSYKRVGKEKKPHLDYEQRKSKTLLSDRAQEKAEGLNLNFDKIKVSDSNGFI